MSHKLPLAVLSIVAITAGALVAQQPAPHQEIGEFYYVMSGEGTVKVGSESAAIRSGDAVPIHLSQTPARGGRGN